MAQTSHASMILGALLFWFASVADGIDGEMARTRMTESARGEQIDTAVDHATHVLVFGGVLVGWWRQGIGTGGLAVMAAIALGLPAMFLGTMALVRSAIGSRQFFVDTKPIEAGIALAAAETSSPTLAAAAKLWVVFRREALALLFFLVSLPTGSRAAYGILVAVGLAIVGFVLTMYRRPISVAIERVSSSSRDAFS
jgi:phosphatidylglycerophosphate synthase